MNEPMQKCITKPSIHDFVDHKPCCTDVEFTMLNDYSFKYQLETIMLHSHNTVAFATNQNNQLKIDFFNFNKFTWAVQLSISINKAAKNFVTLLGEYPITYFIILDPTTVIVKFDEKEWNYQIYDIFDCTSNGAFINDQNIYILKSMSVYCINLLPIHDENNFIKYVSIDNDETDLKDSSISQEDKDSKSFRIKEYKFEYNYFDQKIIFATQQFSRYNLIYRNDEDVPLLIFDTVTHSFCFDEELNEVNTYFKRKISPICPLNEAKFMSIPGKNNGFFLFHDFESYQNSFIPFHEPLVIQGCQNERGESLIIILISIRRISPIIGMFSLPGESFNFISIPSNHYYQFFKARGLLSYVYLSKNFINAKQKNIESQENKISNPNMFNSEKASNLIKEEKGSKKEEIMQQMPTSDILIDQNHQQDEKVSIENNLNDEKNQVSLSMHDIPSKNIQIYDKKQNQIRVIMHFLCLGPVNNIQCPDIEICAEPEYHMIITIPKIPHCLFIKNVEVIVNCVDDNDILSFYLKPSICNNPQKIEVKCIPDSKYEVKMKVSNGYQNTYSDTIEFTTPNPGIPPKVEDFHGTYISDDVYIFKWSAVSDLFNVKHYILEGSKGNSIECRPTEFNPNTNDIELDVLESHIHDNVSEYMIGEFGNQRINSHVFGPDFEYIVELSNDVKNNNICGAKIKITQQYNQFRIKASNLMGIGEPSDPITINQKNNLSQNKSDKKSSSRISKDQVQYLSEYYASNPNPNFTERNKIAELLSLSYQTVNSWFVRKRHIDKVNSKKTPNNNNDTHFSLNLF